MDKAWTVKIEPDTYIPSTNLPTSDVYQTPDISINVTSNHPPAGGSGFTTHYTELAGINIDEASLRTTDIVQDEVAAQYTFGTPLGPASSLYPGPPVAFVDTRQPLEVYNRVPLGEKGRMELKAAIRAALKDKPELRERVNKVAKLRCATIPQLLRIAAICDLWFMALNISRRFVETKSGKQNRARRRPSKPVDTLHPRCTPVSQFTADANVGSSIPNEPSPSPLSPEPLTQTELDPNGWGTGFFVWDGTCLDHSEDAADVLFNGPQI